jgi:hypothetical protein
MAAMRWSDYYDLVFVSEGREYRARYRTSGLAMVEVCCDFGTRTADIHASPPEFLARLMVLELEREELYRQQLRRGKS